MRRQTGRFTNHLQTIGAGSRRFDVGEQIVNQLLPRLFVSVWGKNPPTIPTLLPDSEFPAVIIPHEFIAWFDAELLSQPLRDGYLAFAREPRCRELFSVTHTSNTFFY